MRNDFHPHTLGAHEVEELRRRVLGGPPGGERFELHVPLHEPGDPAHAGVPAGEFLWATAMRPGVARIANVPVWVDELSIDDVVGFVEVDGCHEPRTVIERTFPLRGFAAAGDDEPLPAEVPRALGRIGVRFEIVGAHCLTLAGPAATKDRARAALEPCREFDLWMLEVP